MGVPGVIGTSSRLDAEYSAVRQDKGPPHGAVEGGVVGSVSPWAGATPKGDLYAGDIVDLYTKDLSAMMGAPLEGGTGLGQRRCNLQFSKGSVCH